MDCEWKVGMAGDGDGDGSLRLTVHESSGWNRPRQRVSNPLLCPKRKEGVSHVHVRRTSIPGRENSTDDGPEVEQWGLECMRLNQEADGVPRGLAGHC